MKAAGRRARRGQQAAPDFEAPEIERRVDVPVLRSCEDLAEAGMAGEEGGYVARGENAGRPGWPCIAGGEEDGIGFIVLGAGVRDARSNAARSRKAESFMPEG